VMPVGKAPLASLVRSIAAAALMSAFTIVPSAIFPLVTAPSAISAVAMVPSAIIVLVIVPAGTLLRFSLARGVPPAVALS